MQRQQWKKKGKLIRTPAWQLTKVRNKKDVIEEARNKGRKLHFASLTDLCHLKNSESEPRNQKYKARVVLRVDIVKYDSGSYAVFTDTRIISITDDSRKSHGHHFKTTGMRRTSSGCSICLYPSKNGRCSQIIQKFPNRSVQTFGFVYHDTNGQNHGPVWKTQSFFLNGICTVILWQDYDGSGNLRKLYWNTVGKKFQLGNVYSLTEKKDCSYQCMWTISNWLERSRTNMEKHKWKTLIWENQHHSSTMFIQVALKENVRLARILWKIREACSTQGFLPTLQKNWPERKATRKPDAETISSWSYDMGGHAKKCVDRYCELAYKTTQKIYKVATPCMHDHPYEEEEMKSVGELSKVCSQIVLK